jgi:hypothetical protein
MILGWWGDVEKLPAEYQGELGRRSELGACRTIAGIEVKHLGRSGSWTGGSTLDRGGARTEKKLLVDEDPKSTWERIWWSTKTPEALGRGDRGRGQSKLPSSPGRGAHGQRRSQEHLDADIISFGGGYSNLKCLIGGGYCSSGLLESNNKP